MSSLDGQTKTKALKIIGEILRKHSKGFFQDEYWIPVHDIFSELTFHGIDYVLISADYDGKMTSKRWNMSFEFINDKGKNIIIYGNIIASGAGSVENPLSRYDLVGYCS